MTVRPSLPTVDELAPVLAAAAEEARAYLDSLADRPVLPPGARRALEPLSGALPETGVGAERAVAELAEAARDAAVGSAGGRCFHFVIGGTTPAALGADVLTSAYDQLAYAWVSSPLAVELELVSLAWLADLLELPGEWGSVITTGATMANFVGLACGRQWWGAKHGVDVGRSGLAGLPPVPVFSSGYVHASAKKAVSMLGMGYATVRTFARDAAGRLDLAALERELAALGGAPSILIGNAGEVNAGDFDPIADLADLAERYGAWLHVDGAFGLFARVSPRTRALTEGVERAHSITVDGHKWLNVPYDCGFSFVRDASLVPPSFTYAADYLPDGNDPRPVMGTRGPESSRRARSLAVWATLRAYGREGHRGIVERHLDLAQRLARRVDAAPDLERLADVPLNIVCFRYAPEGASEEEIDRLNERLAERIVEDGRVYVGGTLFEGKRALRPALSCWRTEEADVDVLVDVARELGAALRA